MKKIQKGIDMDTTNQVMDSIRKALEMRKPSKAKIIKYLYNLQANDSLSDFDFFDIIGKTFQLNRKFFMLSIYPAIRSKFKKIYGDERIRIMDKYILEKYCLYEEEQIIYELNGTIHQVFKRRNKNNCQVKNGTLYITNYRILAQGKIEFSMSANDKFGMWFITILYAFNSPKKIEDAYIDHSSNCYGYWFPVKVSPPLIKDNRKISYFSKISESTITIIPSKKGDHVSKLYEIITSKIYEDKANSAEEKQKVEEENDKYIKIGEEVNDMCIKQIQDLIADGIKFKFEKAFKPALKTLNEAQNLSNNMIAPSIKESIIKELNKIKIEIYNDMIKENIELGKQLQTQKKYEEANQKFKTALNLVEEKLNSSPQSIISNFNRINEIREINNLISQSESRKIDTP